jgi:hypothetical protein
MLKPRQLLVVVLFWSVACHAEVIELWRARLPLNRPNLSGKIVTGLLATPGNDLVIAGSLHQRQGESGPFIHKLSADGLTLWEWYALGASTIEFEAAVLDSEGNTLVSFCPNLSEVVPLKVVKLSPDGRLLWQWGEPDIVYGGGGGNTSCALSVDAGGNCFVMLNRRVSGSGYDLIFTRDIVKLSPAGHLVWRATLPPPKRISDVGGLRHAIAMTRDGGVLVCGGIVTSENLSPDGNYSRISVGFVTKLDAQGRMEWQTVDPDTGGAQMYSTVVPTVVGGAVAGGSSGTRGFLSRGRLGAFQPGLIGNAVSHSGADAVFSDYYGNYLYRIDLAGGVRRRSILAMEYGFPGIVGSAANGQVAATLVYNPELLNWETEVLGVDRAGVRFSYGRLVGFGDSTENRLPRLFVVRCPDGSFRAAASLNERFSIRSSPWVSAFRLSAPRGLPRILRPPRTVKWDGRSDVSFRVTTAGSTPVSYQWRRYLDLIPGATGSSLIIPRDQAVASAGFISVEVSNANGSVISPIAELLVDD